MEKLNPALDVESLLSLLIGNMVTSVLRNGTTPLQIALGILIHKKKLVKHLYDYKVTCSYDELRRFKKSSAVARYNVLREEEISPVPVNGLIQHFADNFDADMSSPNGKVSTHAIAMIECFPGNQRAGESEHFARIPKEEIKKPIHFDKQEDELLPFNGTENEQPPPLPLPCLPEEFIEKQRVSYSRVTDLDFDFLKVR